MLPSYHTLMGGQARVGILKGEGGHERKLPAFIPYSDGRTGKTDGWTGKGRYDEE